MGSEFPLLDFNVTGTIKPNQEWFLAEAEKRGYYTICAHGFDEAKQMVEEYLKWR